MDKVKIYGTDFHIKGMDYKSNDLIIPDKPILYTDEVLGVPHRGKKAFLNSNGIGFDITYFPAHRLFVTFSVPKILWGNNVKTVSKSEFKSALLKVETLSKKQGIIFNILEAKLSRIDFCLNIPLQTPYNIYEGFFTDLLGSVPRMEKMLYVDSIYCRNKRHGMKFYDKAKESKISGNLARFEWSLLYANKIKSIFPNIRCIQDICNHWTEMENIFNTEREKLFTEQIEDGMSAMVSWGSIISQYQKNKRRNWWQILKKDSPFLELLKHVDTRAIEALRQTLKNHMGKSQYNDAKKWLRKIILSSPSMAPLYNEIKEAMLPALKNKKAS